MSLKVEEVVKVRLRSFGTTSGGRAGTTLGERTTQAQTFSHLSRDFRTVSDYVKTGMYTRVHVCPSKLVQLYT